MEGDIADRCVLGLVSTVIPRVYRWFKGWKSGLKTGWHTQGVQKLQRAWVDSCRIGNGSVLYESMVYNASREVMWCIMAVRTEPWYDCVGWTPYDAIIRHLN